MNTITRLAAAAFAVIALSGCTGMWMDQCASIGIPAGTPAMAQCVMAKEAMTVNALNQLSSNMTALSVAMTPQTYNVNVYRHW